MFSLLDQVVLRLPPVKEPEQLVIVTVRGNNYGNSMGDNDVSYPMYEDLRDRNQAFSGMFCRFPTRVTLGVGDHVASIDAEADIRIILFGARRQRYPGAHDYTRR